MRWISQILRIARPTHTCRVWFHLLRMVLPHRRVSLSAEEAEERMRLKYADHGRSCLTENKVIDPCRYDLAVIVPAYNAGESIVQTVRCLTSQQTQYKYCAIVVDDGSTDGSVDEAMKLVNDSRITCIRQQNRGVSAARNRALRTIEARYVLFCDADDMLPPDAIQRLLDCAYEADADIVEGSMDVERDGKVSPFVVHHEADSRDRLTGYACGKLFRSTLFAHVGYPEGYRYEDTLLPFILFPMARRVVFVAQTTYVYRQHKGSFTSREMGNYATLDAYWVVRQLLQDVERLGLECDEELYNSVLHGMKLSGLRLSSLDTQTAQAYFAAMCSVAEKRFSGLKGRGRLTYIDLALRQHDYTLYMLAACLL